jgi:hypothetical protein
LPQLLLLSVGFKTPNIIEKRLLGVLLFYVRMRPHSMGKLKELINSEALLCTAYSGTRTQIADVVAPRE